MPESITKYQIFLASPSDVGDERKALEDVIAELNQTYGKRSGKHLELLKWESHSGPGISRKGIQEVINRDIGDSYDLFIGILWKKFGTKTNKAESGTEEEFIRAYSRFQKNPDSLQILFYFKMASPTSMMDIDPSEYGKVLDFKGGLGPKEVLYWEYNKLSELEQFLRMHIPMRIDQLEQKSNGGQIIPDDTDETGEVQIEEELGFLDYIEIVEVEFDRATRALERISEATTWLGGEISKKSREMGRLNKGNQEVARKLVRNLFSRTGDVMNRYADQVEPDTPVFAQSFERGSHAYLELIKFYGMNAGDNRDELEEAQKAISTLIIQMENGKRGLSELLEAVVRLPRMSKELNQARRNVEFKLQELINKVEVSLSISRGLDDNIQTILGN